MTGKESKNIDDWREEPLANLLIPRRHLVKPSSDGKNRYVGLEHLDSGLSKILRYDNDATVRSTKFKFNPGDILYGKLRPYLDKGAMAEWPGVCSTDILVFETNPIKADPVFMSFFIHQQEFVEYAIANTDGVNHPRISWDSLSRYTKKVPSINEQKAISAVLSKIQSAVETQDKTVLSLKKIFKSTLHKLLTGNKTNTRVIGDVTQRTKLVDPSKNPTVNFQYVDVSAVDKDSWAITTTTPHSGSTAPSRARKHIRSGDVIFATVRPTLKRVAIVPGELDGQIASTAFCIIRPINNDADNRFLFYSLLTEEFENKMAAIEHGANYPAVTDKEVLSQAIWLPSLSEQIRISNHLSKIHDKIHLHDKKAEVLKKLFSSMLHLLITGELRVPETLECFNKEVFDV